jgi:hypothetical protein
MQNRFGTAMCVLACVSCAPSGDHANRGRASQFTDEEALTITSDTTAGEPLFLRAADAVRLGDGGVAILDPLLPGVRFFSPDGQPRHTVGRLGSGPGEFQSPLWMDRCSGDSLFVRDGTRMTVLSADGRFGRSFTLPGVPSALMACGAGGMVAVVQLPRMQGASPTNGERRFEGALWLVDAQGDTVRSLGVVSLGEPVPLGRLTRLAMVAHRLYIGTADSAWVEALDLRGGRSAIALGSVQPRPASIRHREAAIDRMLAGWRGPRQDARRYLEQYPVPDHLPVYTELLTDPSGSLWVVLSAPGDSSTSILEIDSDGDIVSRRVLPRDLRIFDVGRDFVLGAYEDALGKEIVTLYRAR